MHEGLTYKINLWCIVQSKQKVPKRVPPAVLYNFPQKRKTLFEGILSSSNEAGFETFKRTTMQNKTISAWCCKILSQLIEKDLIIFIQVDIRLYLNKFI